VPATIGMKPSALPMWVPPFVSSCGYSVLGVYLVDRSFPAAVVGWIPTSHPPTPVVLTIVVTNLWSFFTRLCALTPRVVLSPGWLGGTTNGSTACVVDSTNESRGFVGRPRGGDAAAWLGYTVPNRVGGFFD
jgi:hypothetical protein